MQIEGYDIILFRLTFNQIEMVRNWRNDPKIMRYMAYRDYITPKMQVQWFHKINNENNYYFIINYRGNKIGLINIRDINYQKKEGEGGIFIYDDEWLNSSVPFQATLCLYDFGFETLGLKKLIAHILKDNKRAIKFNRLVGFKLEDGQESVENQLYTLTFEDYIANRAGITQILK